MLAITYYGRLEARSLRRVLIWLSRYAIAILAGSVIGLAVLRLSNRGLLAAVIGGAGYVAAVFALRLVSLPDLLGRTAAARPATVGAEE